MTYLHVKDLRDYIEFEDSMVNKVHLIESGENKLKLIALKKHQELPSHKSEGETFLYVLEGEVKFYVLENEICECNECTSIPDIDEEHVFPVKKGEFIRYNDDVAHKVIAEKDAKILVACFK